MPYRDFKPCEWCESEMLTWRPTQRYCCKDCRGAAERHAKGYPVAQWCALYRDGMGYKKISERYGVAYNTVRKSVQYAGVKPRTDWEHFRKYWAPKGKAANGTIQTRTGEVTAGDTGGSGAESSQAVPEAA